VGGSFAPAHFHPPNIILWPVIPNGAKRNEESPILLKKIDFKDRLNNQNQLSQTKQPGNNDLLFFTGEVKIPYIAEPLPLIDA
jgi:hypothetical protein